MDPIIFSKPLLPSGERWPLGVDLRAALCQLQLELSHADHGHRETLRNMRSTEGANQGKTPKQHKQGTDKDWEDLLAVSRMTDVISLANADLARRPSTLVEVSPDLASQRNAQNANDLPVAERSG